jgi:hypothetical protein
MKSREFDAASRLLRRLIEQNATVAETEEFIGLGSKAEEEGFSEGKGYEWYEQRYGENLSLYDLLAVCNLKANSDFK